MDTVVSGARGQDETGPFPFEFNVVARRKRVVHREGRSQDETAPFPREFEIVSRRVQQSQDETSPFLLEFMVILPNGESAFVRTARPPRARSTKRRVLRGLPRLKWHGAEASRELREYAARIAAGESLPPFRGPILANGESPRVRQAPLQASAMSASAMPASAVTANDSKASVKLVLALIVMSAFIVAAAVLGDDAQLRSLGQAISHWFAGSDDSSQLLSPSEPAQSPPESPAPQR